MTDSNRLHWGRAIAGAFLAEVGIFVVVIPILLLWGEWPEQLATPPTVMVMIYLATVWVLRGVQSRFVQHGFIVGLLALLMWEALAFGQPRPVLFVVAQVLKVVVGVATGLIVQRRRARAVSAAV